MTIKISVHIHADTKTTLCLGNQIHRTFTFGARGKTKALALANIKTMLMPLYCRFLDGEDNRDINEDLEHVKRDVIRVIETTDLGMARTRNATGFNWEIRMENKDG